MNNSEFTSAKSVSDLFKIWHSNKVSHLLIVVFVTNLFLTFLSSLLYLSYMAHYHFYSYDFFKGFLGVNSFTFTISLIILLTTFILWFWFFILFRYLKVNVGQYLKEKESIQLDIFNSKTWSNRIRFSFKELCVFWASIILAIVGWYFLITMATECDYDDRDFKLLSYITLLTIIVFTHLCYVYHTNFKKHIYSMVIVTIAIMILSFNNIYRENTRQVISTSLKIYNVGGDVVSEACPKDHTKKCIVGDLILLSPDHLYIKTNGNNEVTTFKRSDFFSIRNFRKEKPCLCLDKKYQKNCEIEKKLEEQCQQNKNLVWKSNRVTENYSCLWNNKIRGLN